MSGTEPLAKLRSLYPDVIEQLETLPVWGYRFRFSRPMGALASEMAGIHLSEQLEVPDAVLTTTYYGSEESHAGHTVLDMLVRGASDKAANQHALRVVAPLTARLESGVAVVGVEPLMPEDAYAYFKNTDTRIPDTSKDFDVMMDPAIL